ncbi:hypothetical protein [Cryptosporangium aurantiacum]|uniref:Uncharacterized protein n=1 Tax=Cryptosporangium aurantiacum TaxID=134849 RepID=A0A1M7R171_9ACTN|nr:hypothetical protein [Cryptosporangium aurantiacum]SHN38513.1 hypothetical protein SAMN05443668_10689 [Cryptosporangium aurantiacum]
MAMRGENGVGGGEWRRDRPSDAGRRLADVLALEYGHLKEEQRARIATRDNLVYTTLAAQAVLAGTALTSGRPQVLLLVPLVCAVLGWTRIVNDLKITHIRRYIDGVLRPRLQAWSASREPVLAWEVAHRAGTQYRVQKAGQILVDLLLYCVPSLAAPVVAVLLSDSDPAVVVAAAPACLVAVALGLLAVLASERPRWTPWDAEDGTRADPAR